MAFFFCLAAWINSDILEYEPWVLFSKCSLIQRRPVLWSIWSFDLVTLYHTTVTVSGQKSMTAAFSFGWKAFNNWDIPLPLLHSDV